jgi:transposase
MSEKGAIVKERNMASKEDAIKGFIGKKDGVYRIGVMEASRNWTVMYEWLEDILDEVKLAHPLKVRAIAEAKIKTDKIDARTLAHLLRSDLIPEAYVPGKETREARCVLRHRMFLVKLRTMVKNRIHVLLDKYPVILRPPRTTDVFGATGLRWMKEIRDLSKTDRELLDESILVYEALDERIASSSEMVKKLGKDDHRVKLLESVPGIGLFFAVLMANEIDDISRFRTAGKLLSYAGLIPSTYASGAKTFHGRLIKQGNKWIRWAMVEAVWPAVRKDASLCEYYARIKSRKGPNVAKIAVARRLLTIIYRMLRQRRMYEVR